METLTLTVSEAAKIIGISRRQAYTLIAARELPSIRIRSSIRVPKDALHEWVKANTEHPLDKKGEVATP
jgi:excisionase family DNA binding protein